MINVLSLDVAAGAMICASFFARLMDVAILPQGLISLGLTVWVIYTADHLLDAKKLNQAAATERHRFHQRHFNVLLGVMILAIVVDATQIYFIRRVVFFSGLWLSLLVAVYFLIQQRFGFMKELLGSLLYTGGVLLIPLSVKGYIPGPFILPVLQFGMVAWINLLLFSMIDQWRDEKDHHPSFATTFGQAVTGRVLLFLFILSALLSVIQLSLFPSKPLATLILVLMSIFLLFIFLKKKYFEREDRYRLLGDAVFMLPFIYLLF